jgi:hypothetical protein
VIFFVAIGAGAVRARKAFLPSFCAEDAAHAIVTPVRPDCIIVVTLWVFIGGLYKTIFIWSVDHQELKNYLRIIRRYGQNVFAV